MIDRNDASGPGHVFYNDGRISRHVLAEMTGDETAVGIKEATRRIADDEPDVATLESGVLSKTSRDKKRQNHYERDG